MFFTQKSKLTRLLAEAKEDLEYWQEQILNDPRPSWCQGKIDSCFCLIQELESQLEDLKK